MFRKNADAKNGRGFNKFDANFLTNVAEYVQRNGFMTRGQQDVVAPKLVKYARQFEEAIASGELKFSEPVPDGQFKLFEEPK